MKRNSKSRVRRECRRSASRSRLSWATSRPVWKALPLPVLTITRTVDGQQGPAVQATLADSYRYLTSFERLPLFSTAELSARGGYRVEIRAILDGGGEPKIETTVLAEGALVR